jgi:hypothetical protein
MSYIECPYELPSVGVPYVLPSKEPYAYMEALLSGTINAIGSTF